MLWRDFAGLYQTKLNEDRRCDNVRYQPPRSSVFIIFRIVGVRNQYSNYEAGVFLCLFIATIALCLFASPVQSEVDEWPVAINIQMI